MSAPPQYTQSSSSLSTGTGEVSSADTVLPQTSLQVVDAGDNAVQKHDFLTEHERELLELEARLNAEIDATIKANMDKHPKAVFFIIPSKFGERFGISSISRNANKYFMQRVGMDRYDAKKWAIVFFTLVALFGMILLVIFSVPNLLGSMSYGLAFLPFVILALGNGGIRPCVSSHGGDQYLPLQVKKKDQFFTLYFVAGDLSSFLAGLIVPALADRPCMGAATCYPGAFMVGAAIIFMSLVIFAAGRRWYRVVPPLGEFLPWKALKAVALAASRYSKATSEERDAMGHWLNFAEDKYGGVFLDECRDFGLTLGLTVIPCSFCRMLFVQENSEWSTQYYQMNGALFGQNSKILAAQFQNFPTVFSIITMMVLIYVVYPFLERRGYDVRLTNRLKVGYFLTILAFICSGILSHYVEEAFLLSGRDPKKLADYDGTYCETCVSGWAQVPQWILLSLGDCLFVPSGAQFVYIESGRQLRASSLSYWLIAGSFGAIWVNIFDPVMLRGGLSTMARSFTYSGIATAGLLFFVILERFYVPRKERKAINQAAQEAKEAQYLATSH
ncbi:hypothetical protein DFQ26_003862 [Actinomortierella ambigua]|nr:hypothetical protein DFQ26_003862 [Actinomortierella ambigua]